MSPTPPLLPSPLRAPRLGAPGPAWRALVHAACQPYRPVGRFPYHFAAGKLGRDPVFAELLRQGLLRPGARVLDIGCGQGVLAALLHACDAAPAWPEGWAPPPRATRYHGLDLMPRDIARGQAALSSEAVRFECADMRQAAFPPSDLVVILDVLHYVDHAAQDDVLRRVHACLAPGGRLLLRVGDSQQRLGFAISQWVDRAVTRVRGHRVPPTWGRSVAQWAGALQRLGFRVQPQPMSQGTPFANVLLVAERGPEGAA